MLILKGLIIVTGVSSMKCCFHNAIFLGIKVMLRRGGKTADS